jgi:hypothetical protein
MPRVFIPTMMRVMIMMRRVVILVAAILSRATMMSFVFQFEVDELKRHAKAKEIFISYIVQEARISGTIPGISIAGIEQHAATLKPHLNDLALQ